MGYGDLVTSAYLTSLAASAPFWLKLTLKAPVAAAFNYHTFNGLRHLAWDKGYCEYSGEQQREGSALLRGVCVRLGKETSC